MDESKLLGTAKVLVKTYAVPDTAFAERSGANERSVTPAIETRSGMVRPRGQWRGVTLPREAGKMNFDPNGPPSQSVEEWRTNADLVIGGMGGMQADWVCGGMGG